MSLNEYGTPGDNPGDANDIPTPSNRAEPVPVAQPTGPEPAKQPRIHPQKVEEPKSMSFSARATAAEHARITGAMHANGRADIVRLMLYALDLFENDILTPFKTR